MKKVISLFLIVVLISLMLFSCEKKISFQKMSKDECWSQLKQEGAILPDNQKDSLLDDAYEYAKKFENEMNNGSFMISVSSFTQEQMTMFAHIYLAVYSYYGKTPTDKDTVEQFIQQNATIYENYCNQ